MQEHFSHVFILSYLLEIHMLQNFLHQMLFLLYVLPDSSAFLGPKASILANNGKYTMQKGISRAQVATRPL